MQKFKKRANVQIEAYQLTEEAALSALINKTELPGLKLASASWNDKNNALHYARFTCVTVHGQETNVEVGDWIITEPDGIHHYPCKPDIFAETYEPA